MICCRNFYLYNYLIYFAVFIIGISSSVFCFRYIKDMLKKSNFTQINYRGEEIPIGMGIVFVILSPILIILVSLLTRISIIESLLISFGIMAMGFVGIIDDFLGNKDAKGFKGHIKAIFRGELTTGGFKAVVGFIIAFLISFLIYLIFNGRIIDIFINTLLISLFTNIINLFDLRPGRACKVYLFFLIIINLFVFKITFNSLILFSIILGYIRKDLKAEVMLGDTGSNSLGISLGIIAAILCPIEVRIGFLISLLILHVISEFFSFSAIIEKNRALKFLDDLGRRNKK